MIRLRKSILSKLFALLAGVTFLNMSFVLAELSALGFSRTSTLVQNFINTGFEEEKEGGESSEPDSTVKEIYFSTTENLQHHSIDFLSGSKRDRLLTNLTVEPGYFEIMYPPPEA